MNLTLATRGAMVRWRIMVDVAGELIVQLVRVGGVRGTWRERASEASPS